jgi:hypothetical protein
MENKSNYNTLNQRERSYSASSTSTTNPTSSTTEQMTPNPTTTRSSTPRFMDLFSAKASASKTTKTNNSSTSTRPRASSWNEDQERKTTSNSFSSGVMQELILDTRNPILDSEFQEVDLQEAIIAEREKAVRDANKQMVGLNQVFQDFALLVHEQGDAVENIERSVEQAKHHSKKAVKELEGAEKKQEVNTAITATLATVGTAAVALIVLL